MNRPSAARWRVAAWASLGVLVVAGLGGAATEIGPWYGALRQPAWKPPDAWFGPIWTVIYLFVVAAIVVSWGAATVSVRRTLLWLWLANAALNVAWSVLFFELRRPDWALAEVGLLWLSVLALVLTTARASRTGAALLVTYLLWVSVAAVLTLSVVQLNGPFVGS
jgi:tryptophan-rich sensory protein